MMKGKMTKEQYYQHLEQENLRLKEELKEAEQKFVDLNKIVSTFCNKNLGTLDDLMGSILGWLYYDWSVEDCIDPENIGNSE